MPSDIPQIGFTGVIRDDEFPDGKDLVGGLEEAVARTDPGLLPKEFHAADFSPDLILNQGQEPICVGCAGRTMLSIWEKMDAGLPKVMKNENDLYAMSRARFKEDYEKLFEASGTAFPDGGTTLRSLLKALHKDLAVLERYVRVDPSAKHKLLIDGLKALLVLRHAVPVVLQNIAWNRNGVLSFQPDGGKLQHAVCFTGYSDASRVFVFPNSWGRKWGDDGIGLLPYSIVSAATLSSGWGLTPSMTL